MLSLTVFLSCTLVLGSAIVVRVVELRSLTNPDGGGLLLYSRAPIDEIPSTRGPGYRQISIQPVFDDEEGFSEENSFSARGILEDEHDVYDNAEEDRSKKDWRKIRRYIKRQLKVPKRFIKKIKRKLGVKGTLRSANAAVDRNSKLVSLVAFIEADYPDDGFGSKKLFLIDEPAEYF